jgi:predicted DNA-binding protein (MmcQ/YjbR family)
MARASDKIVKELRAYGLSFPGAHLKSPWPGHKDLAVNDKTFAYLSIEGEPFSISCKLPSSNAVALMLPFVKPAEYGLGKSGWVAARFEDHEPPVEMLKAWIDESYRAQAPKKLLKELDGAVATPAKSAAPKPAPKPVKSARKPSRATTKAAPKRATAAKRAAAAKRTRHA